MKKRAQIFVLVLLATSAATLCQVESTEKGWIGVLLANPDQVAEGVGVRISRIIKDTPSDRYGIRAGDTILQVNGQDVASVAGLISTIGGLPPNEWVSFRIERQGKERDVRIKLTARPAGRSGFTTREGWIGLKTIDLPESLRVHFGAPEKAGVMVSDIDEASPAFIAGLELGDVVYSVGGDPVRSSAQLLQLIGGGGVGNSIEIGLMRSGVEITVEAMVEEMPAELRRSRRR